MDPALLPFVGAGAVAGAVMLLGLVVVGLRPSRPRGVARSLQVIERSRTDRGLARQQLPAGDRLVAPVRDLLARVGRRLSPRQSPVRLQRLLDFAGNPAGWTVESMLAAKGGGVFAGAAVGLVLSRFGPWSIVLVPAGAAAGGWLPDVLMHNAGQRRQLAVRRSLADALDMLSVCVEAGLGFDAAMTQVARNTDGPFAGELARALQEVQLGRSRTEALQQMADRVDVHELRTFVTAMVQADRLGIPVADVLREQSHQMRLRRRQDAEERAQKVTVKILFPLVFCIFPALLVVVMGPAIMRLVETFATTPGMP